MNIENGWRFVSADFSLLAYGHKNAIGTVMLVRAPEERVKWHAMSEENISAEDGPPLFVVGQGLTLEEAIVNANMSAAHAIDIIA